jgi:16S rRNA (cytidine1402-2'-O)-methyltransferase
MGTSSAASLGSIYLIPSLLGDSPVDAALPAAITTTVSKLKHFLVEDEKSARAFIKVVAPSVTIQGLSLRRLNEHTQPAELEELMAPLYNGEDIGILSEAGCPAIADPGSLAVAHAHRLGARVYPLVGPCSMVLALMASGLNGQSWRFHGYLPVDATQRKAALRALERDVQSRGETQIFMDTPYRNQRMLEDLLEHCAGELLLCIASELTTPREEIRTRSVAQWKELRTTLPKAPALFLLGR